MRWLLMFVALAGCSDNDDIPAPRVADVMPASATPGAVVTVGGAYFCQQPDTGGDDPLDCSNTGDVWFGAVPGVPTLWTDSAISVEVPDAAAGTVQLYVSAGGRSSNTVTFAIAAN
jgi:hypothetical protein